MPTGPDLEKTDVGTSGCPTLTEWAAEEAGIGRKRIEIWITDGLASARDVQPCDACANLRGAAKILEDAGADALELNMFFLPSDMSRDSKETEQLYFKVIGRVQQEVSIPIIVKMSYYFSSLSQMIRKLSEAGVAGVAVLRHRKRRIDPQQLHPEKALSHARLHRRPSPPSRGGSRWRRRTPCTPRRTGGGRSRRSP